MRTKHRIQARAKRQNFADPMAMFRVLGRVQPFTESEQVNLNLPVRLAFEALRTGKASEDDFHTLAASVNIAMICSEQMDPLVEQTCIAARDSLMTIHSQHATGYTPTPDVLADIEQAVDIYSQLTSLMTGGHLADAMAQCVKRMKAGNVMEVGG